ncbi:MAG: ATP-dependent 6-phosphofructokinase [Clostridia bacterium]|nr:ATP-dependent 6-phosphofructokinase [Clostridia bacterium]
MLRKIAILTNGGDAPGLNAVIRAIVKVAEKNNVEAYGFIEGYKGLLENNYIKLDSNGNAAGLLHRGGTIIGASNSTNVFNFPEKDENGQVVYKDLSNKCMDNLKALGIDCLFTLGGDGTQKSARDFSVKGLNVIGIPKTIDNDVAYTDVTFGFNTAVEVATEALDRLHTTAASHHRVMVLEVMGRYAGWIALESAIAGGADVCLIPEIPYDMEKVVAKINERQKMGKGFSIVVVSEGAKPKDGSITVKRTLDDGKGVDNVRLGGIGEKVAMDIENMTGMATRNTTLGYVQRGGSPIPYDRILSTKFGSKAMELALEGKFNVLVTYNNGHLSCASLEDVVGMNKEIGAASGSTAETNIRKIEKDNEELTIARNIGICFGD